MGSELIDLLEREAEAERQRLLAEARERAERLVQEAQADAQALLEAQRRRLAAAVEAARVRARGVAQLRATSRVLEAKDQQLEEVFRRAAAQLERVVQDPDRYGRILRGLLREAAEGFNGPVVVECAERDAAAVEAAARELGLHAVQVRTDPSLREGVRVRSEDGRFVVENTLSSRLQRARQLLLAEVADVLWEA
jgi:V/A-type H+-transporting ATPase subunit E